jgi:Skp family chaperone for outer membrane proteins
MEKITLSAKQFKRYEEKLKDAFRELRGENNRLKKEVARLRKQLRKEFETEDLLGDEVDEEIETPKKEDKDKKCQQCGEDSVTKIDLNRIVLDYCQSCGYKRNTKKKEV